MKRMILLVVSVAVSTFACKRGGEKEPQPSAPRTGGRISEGLPAPASPKPFLVTPTPVEEALIATLPEETDSVVNDHLTRYWNALFEISPPKKVLSRSTFLSPDTRTYAYPVRSGKRWVMVTNGQKGTEEFDQVGIPQFLGNGAVVYEARRGKKSLLVVNGSVQGEYDRIAMPMRIRVSTANNASTRMEPVSSADGKLWSCVATRGGHDVLVSVPQRESAEFDQIGEVVYGPRGSTRAFPARTGRRWSVVVEGVRGPEHDEIRHLTLGPSGEAAYAGRLGRRWALVYKGKRGPEFDDVENVVLGPGAHVAYSARIGKQHRMVMDEREGELFDVVRDPTFATDGRLAYVAIREKKAYLIVDGKMLGPQTDVTTPAFTRSGELVFAAKMDKSWRMVVGKDEGPTFDKIGPPASTEATFSTAGGLQNKKPVLRSEHSMGVWVIHGVLTLGNALSFVQGADVIYVGTQRGDGGERSSLVVGGNIGPVFGNSWGVSLQEGSLKEGYAVEHGDRWQIVSKGVGGPSFDSVHSLLIGAGGTPVYVAQQEKKWFVVAGDRRGPPCDEIWLYGFDAEGRRVVYGALEGRNLSRKIMEIR